MSLFVRQGHAADWEYILYDGEHPPEIASFFPFNDEYIIARHLDDAYMPTIDENGLPNHYVFLAVSEKSGVRRINENLILQINSGIWRGKKSLLVYHDFLNNDGTYTSFTLYNSNFKEIIRLPVNAQNRDNVADRYFCDDCLFVKPEDGSTPFYMIAYTDNWPRELITGGSNKDVPFLMALSEDGRILWKKPQLNADGSPIVYRDILSAREGAYVHAQDNAGSYILKLSYQGEVKRKVSLPKECASDNHVDVVWEFDERENHKFANSYMGEKYLCKMNKENGNVSFSKVPAERTQYLGKVFPMLPGKFIGYNDDKRELFLLDKNYELQGRYNNAKVEAFFPTPDLLSLVIVASRKPDLQNQKRVQLFISRISQKDFKSVTN